MGPRTRALLILEPYSRRTFLFHLAITLIATPATVWVIITFLGIAFRGNQQQLHWDTAKNVAAILEAKQRDPYAEFSIKEQLDGITSVSPDIEIYLLTPAGEVRFSSLAEPPEILRINDLKALQPLFELPEPIRSPELYCQNPRIVTEQREPCSLAEVTVGGEQLVVYIIAASAQRLANVNYAEAMAWKLGWVLGSLMILGGYFTAVSLERVSVRDQLIAISETLTSIHQGDFSARIRLPSSGEFSRTGKQLNDILDRFHQALQLANKLDVDRREMISNISHDLNTPLASALGYIRRLRAAGGTAEVVDQERFLQIACLNLETLERLIRELFELSTLETQEVKLEPVRFSILDMVTEEIIPALEPLAQEYGITLKSEYEESLPLVIADDKLIFRALSNIVQNAIRYNRPGGEVEVILKARDSEVEVSVRDTGAGMEPGEIDKIFDRSYRGDPGRTKGAGSGLGLAIVKKILEFHHKTIRVESTVNIGSCFTFTLDRG